MLFELRDVSLARGGRPVLDAVGAEIPAGATAIVGPSGSGKSTLLRLLNRLADPDRGTISYRGRPLAEYDPLALRREVSLVPQLPALLEGTVESNLRYAAGLAGKELDAARCLRPRRPRPRVRRARRRQALGRRAAAGDAGARARPAARRAAARRADLGARPRRPRRDRGDARRAAAASSDISLVLVTHDPEQARRLGDWVVRLEAGRAVAAGPLEEVLA